MNGESMIITIDGTLIGIFAGGIITRAVSRHYYWRASRELTAETAELRRLNVLMLHGMEHEGWVELSRDHAGNMTGFHLHIQLEGLRSAEEFGPPTIIQHAPRQPTP
jgi:hypothetical protein